MNNEELLAATAVNAWKATIDQLDRLLSALTNEQLQIQVSPGRNRVYYIVGHLAALHDKMLPLLGLGARLHPELDGQFLKPDRSVPDTLSAVDLRRAFDEINATLTKEIQSLAASEWLKRHVSVSETDFASNPLRNRLAVLLSRTGHAMFHAGQIRLAQ
jgi:hypothetical protein